MPGTVFGSCNYQSSRCTIYGRSKEYKESKEYRLPAPKGPPNGCIDLPQSTMGLHPDNGKLKVS